jgi:hypothetical protein
MKSIKLVKLTGNKVHRPRENTLRKFMRKRLQIINYECKRKVEMKRKVETLTRESVEL